MTLAIKTVPVGDQSHEHSGLRNRTSQPRHRRQKIPGDLSVIMIKNGNVTLGLVFSGLSCFLNRRPNRDVHFHLQFPYESYSSAYFTKQSFLRYLSL